MARLTVSEDEAGDLFARQMNDLRAEGPAPDSEAQLAAIFAQNEKDCRDLEDRQAADKGRAALSPQR